MRDTTPPIRLSAGRAHSSSIEPPGSSRSVAGGAVVSISPGFLDALCNPYELDGRVSTHPRHVRGYAPMNCYLLREGEHCVLIDTGLSIHQDAIIQQLESLLSPTTVLSLMPLRFGEFNSICNVRPIAEHFPVRTLYGNIFGEPAEWLNFRPGYDLDGGPLRGLEARPIPTKEGLAVDPERRRVIELVSGPIRLLPFPWAYDEKTRTAYTSDLFTWVSRDTDSGPWLVGDADDDATSEEDVAEILVGNRYWWLPGANTDGIRAALAGFFERFDVETIAPAYGCVLHGRGVVERHYGLLDRVLAAAAQGPSQGVAVGRWTTAG